MFVEFGFFFFFLLFSNVGNTCLLFICIFMDNVFVFLFTSEMKMRSRFK